MQTSESGISAKSLRGRDSTRKQDASEKVRMLQPVEGHLVPLKNLGILHEVPLQKRQNVF